MLNLAGDVFRLDAGEEWGNVPATAAADASHQSHKVGAKINVGDLGFWCRLGDWLLLLLGRLDGCNRSGMNGALERSAHLGMYIATLILLECYTF